MARAWELTLKRIETLGVYPPHAIVESGLNEPLCVVDRKEYLSFAANNYLSLSRLSELKEGARKAIEQDGAGPGNSRVIGGTSRILHDLEEVLAKWTGFESCLTFPTGYMANVSVIRALTEGLYPDQEIGAGVILSDQFNHGSIIDGCRGCSVTVVRYRHDNLDDLERKLQRYASTPNKIIVTQGIFCLEGTTIDLPAYVSLAKRFDCSLMVDDAHGIGILGPTGGGVSELFGCADGVDLYMACMDKAMGGTGGFLCGSQSLIKFLKVACRSSILSSPLPSMMAGAMLESVQLIRANPSWREQLIAKSCQLRSSLNAAGYRVLGKHCHPAIPIYVGDDQEGITWSQRLWDAGIHLPLMRWPAVPQNKSRFRLNLTRSHTDNQLDQVLTTLRATRPAT